MAPQFKQLSEDDIVLGFDEWNQEWHTVQYRKDSNLFFDYPYTGAVWPKFRMNKFKALEGDGTIYTIVNPLFFSYIKVH